MCNCILYLTYVKALRLMHRLGDFPIVYHNVKTWYQQSLTHVSTCEICHSREFIYCILWGYNFLQSQKLYADKVPA